MSNINKKIKNIMIMAIMFICTITIKVYASDNNITDTFKDENLKNEILELAKKATGEESKTEIYISDIDKIVETIGGTTLKLANKGIKDLSGIEVFAEKEVSWIFLDWNEITNLTPLQNFKNLTKISFSGNKVSDLIPLSKIETLENIIAINNEINTIEPIKDLTNIKYICLDGNNIDNIDVIANWTKLEKFSFQNNQIKRIPNLSKLEQLNTINLSNNIINTLNDIGQIHSLENLEIDNNELTDLDGIGYLQNLKVLSCGNNKLSTLKGIENVIYLENLNLNKNQLQDIEGISKNQYLKYVYFDNNSIANFEELRDLENLEKYSIFNQTITVEVNEKIVSEYISIPLPKIYKDLYDKNSFIYVENLTTQVLNNKEFEIDENNDNIKLKAEDVLNNSITIQVSNSQNIMLNYNIIVDRQAPTVVGIENNTVYNSPVKPVILDKDILEVKLIKDGQEIDYVYGEQIGDYGEYIFFARDFIGNETRIYFKIEYQFEIDEVYEINGEYVENISYNTKLEIFNKNLNANLRYDVYRNNQLLKEEQFVATGDKLLTENGKIYYLVVRGDISKEGNTNIKDLVKLRKYLLKLEIFDELELKAADLTKDGKATIKDLVQIRNLILN